MLKENQTNFSFEESKQKLEQAITDHSWGKLHVHDIHSILSNKGLKIDRLMVYEICKPAYAYKLMSVDEEKILSPMLPCRVTLYEKSDISRMDIGLFTSNMSPLTKEVMNTVAEELEQTISSIIKLD